MNYSEKETKVQRDSFVFYKSFAKAIKALDAENAKALMEAIFDFALEDEEPEIENPLIEAMFELIRPQLEANKKRYENAKKGGRPKTETKPNENQTETKQKPKANQNKTETKPNENQTETKQKPNVNDNVNVNDNENVNEDNKKNIEHTRGEKFLSFDEAKNKAEVQVKLNELNVDEDFLLHLLAYRQEIKEPVKRIPGLMGLLNKFVEVKLKAKIDPLKAFEIMQEYEWKTPEAILKRSKSYSKTSKLEQKQLNTLKAVENFIKGA